MILHVLTDPDRRGAQVFAADLRDAISRRGRAVRAVALAPGLQDGSLPIPTLGPGRLSISTLRALRSEIASASVVIGFGSTTLPACAIAGWGTGTPFIYLSIGDLRYWANTMARRTRLRGFLRQAAAVVAHWSAAGEDLDLNFGVKRDRIRIIPRGVPVSSFPVIEATQRRDARRALGLDPKVSLLVLSGALAPEKNVDLAIEAVSLIDECHLVIVGDGPERQRLARLAAARAPARIHFAGFVADPFSVLAAADAVILTSRTEGMPGVLIEAGLSGLPAVATSVGAVPEVVVSGRTGALVAPDTPPRGVADAIVSVLGHSSALGTAARRHCVKRFELEVVTSAWLELIDGVVGSARSGGTVADGRARDRTDG
jgi:glycosyltransferase involved in cell wall biosynthesis